MSDPALPTLADLIEAGNDPKQHQWMACEVKEPDSAPSKGHITFLSGGFSYVLFTSGISGTFADNHITPLPDLPRIEWPAQIELALRVADLLDQMAEDNGRLADSLSSGYTKGKHDAYAIAAEIIRETLGDTNG